MRALALILLGGTALVAAHNWLGLGGSSLDFAINGPIYDAVIAAAGVACLVRARSVPRERPAWVLIALAIFSWAAAEIYWTWFILDNPAAPYPSPADAGYLAFYPLAITGLILLVGSRAHHLDGRLWLDGLIATLGTAALGATFVFDVVAGQTTGTPLQAAISLSYPAGDIVVLSIAVGAIALSGWQPNRTWSLLLAGLATQVVADIAYTLESVNGVASVDWIEPFYVISALLLALAAWQSASTPSRPLATFKSQHELAVPIVFAVVMTGLFLMQSTEPASMLSSVLRGVTVLAIIARLALSVRENKALLVQVRTDSLTGLSNRGKMQVDLQGACASATQQDPVALILFDLNGFKRYNDTFGHPAGDALLVKLSDELRQALGEDGVAYRIGGDEFCALVTCPEVDFDRVARRAARALSAEDRGVTVASSWGMVVIPSEVTEPADAMQLADVRMYAQKEAGRVNLDADGRDGDHGQRDATALRTGVINPALAATRRSGRSPSPTP